MPTLICMFLKIVCVGRCVLRHGVGKRGQGHGSKSECASEHVNIICQESLSWKKNVENWFYRLFCKATIPNTLLPISTFILLELDFPWEVQGHLSASSSLFSFWTISVSCLLHSFPLRKSILSSQANPLVFTSMHSSYSKTHTCSQTQNGSHFPVPSVTNSVYFSTLAPSLLSSDKMGKTKQNLLVNSFLAAEVLILCFLTTLSDLSLSEWI